MSRVDLRTAYIRLMVGMGVVAVSSFAFFFVYDLLNPKPFVATARFLIVPDKPSFLDKPDLDYERRNEIFRQTQLANIKSKEVILAALREPGIAALAVLAPCEDKVEWIIENVRAELLAADVDDDKDGLIDEDSRTLQIQIHGTEDQADDLRNLVDAVSTAYMRDVVYKDQQREADARDAESKALFELRDRLVTTIEKRNSMRDEFPGGAAELEVIEIEIEEMTTVFRHLISKRDLKELAGGIGHVRQIKSVAGTFDAPLLENLFRRGFDAQ